MGAAAFDLPRQREGPALTTASLFGAFFPLLSFSASFGTVPPASFVCRGGWESWMAKTYNMELGVDNPND